MRKTNSELAHVDQLLMLAFDSPSRRTELELYTKVQPDGWFVIEEDDAIVAAAGCIVYGSFSWIGLVGTHPSTRGRGLGTRLSEHLVNWSYAKGCRTVALDASKLGRPIYERLGFKPVGSTVQLRSTRVQERQKPEATISPLSAAIPDQLLELDAGIFGGDRSRLLELLIRGENRLVTHQTAGRLSGFVVLQERLIGPGAAASREAAQALIQTAILSSSPQQKLVLPLESIYLDLLVSLGFVVQARLTHMRHGDPRIGGSRGHLLAQTSYAAG